jgi:hypothetical protein
VFWQAWPMSSRTLSPVGAHAPVAGGLCARGASAATRFAELFRHPAVRRVPVVIETVVIETVVIQTPGEAPENTADVALLRALRDSA